MTKPANVVHRAKWVVLTPEKIIENGYISVMAGRIKEVGTGFRGDGRVIDHGQGVLMPGLVNAHTHLELSALNGKISFDDGFRKWVARLLELRESLGRDELLSAADNELDALYRSGCVSCGEVSTLGLTGEIFLRSPMQGVWFQEHLGSAGECAVPAGSKKFKKAVSLAGHAPHTTSPGFLRNLKRKTVSAGTPFSIHLAESDDETEFISTGRGGWADFLTMRGIDFSTWPLPCKTPVKYLNLINILDEKTIAVHLVSADMDDLHIIKDKGVRVCLCPRSNINLHSRLPNIEAMLDLGIKPCLGTDSLASTQSLDIFDEMAFIASRFPSISPSQILSMATLNGAITLGVDKDFGTIEPGKAAKFIFLQLAAETSENLIESIVHDAPVISRAAVFLKQDMK